MKILGLFIVLIIGLNIFSFGQVDSLNKDMYDMDLMDLMNIQIVSASKKAENLFDAPLNSSVLTGAQIVSMGATSIMEALRMMPGVIVRELTPGNYDIHIKGFDNIDFKGSLSSTANTTTLIMINGRPIYTDFQGKTYWEFQQIGIDDIDRIELVQGPVAAMYGPNAVTGVINILTKKPTLQTKGFFASTYSQVGTKNTYLINPTIGYNFNEKFGVKLSSNFDIRDRHNVDYFILSRRNSNGDTIGWVNRLDSTMYDVQNLIVANPYTPVDKRYSNLDKRYPNPEMATNRRSINLHSNYTTESTNLNLMAGYSNSLVQTSYSINNFTPLSTDSSTAYFMHIWGNYKNLSINTDYNGGSVSTLGCGTYNIDDFKTLNTSVEYNLDLVKGKLNLKPGLSYKNSQCEALQLGSKKVTPETYELQNGVGVVENSTLSAFIRAEGSFKKIRLIGALRADKFETPDVVFFSPLLIATYKPSDVLLFRTSYGRACRNPFMINTFSDFVYPSSLFGGLWKLNVGVYGNAKENLLTVDQFELGARVNLFDRISLDIGGALAKMKNMDVIQKYSRVQTTSPSGVVIDMNTSYFNIDAVATQYSGNIILNAKINDKISLSASVTIQTTIISQYPDSIAFTYRSDSTVVAESIDSHKDSDNKVYLDDFTSKATPTIYGGFNVSYSPIKKLSVNLNSYFYSKQTQSINLNVGSNISPKGYDEFEVPSNLLLNATIGYDVYKNTKLFISGHNLIGSGKRQFGLSDKIERFYTIGLSFRY